MPPRAERSPRPTQVPQVRPGSGPPSAPYVAVTEFDRQEEYNRWLPIVKNLLLIPHWFVLFFLWIAAFFAIVGSWFMVLFTGKYPPGIHGFVTGHLPLDDPRHRVRVLHDRPLPAVLVR